MATPATQPLMKFEILLFNGKDKKKVYIHAKNFRSAKMEATKWVNRLIPNNQLPKRWYHHENINQFVKSNNGTHLFIDEV